MRARGRFVCAQFSASRLERRCAKRLTFEAASGQSNTARACAMARGGSDQRQYRHRGKPDEVMAVIADFEHYPDWVDSMKGAEVLTSVAGRAKTVHMVLDHTLVKERHRPGIRVEAARRPAGNSSREVSSGDGWFLHAQGQRRQNNGDIHAGR